MFFLLYTPTGFDCLLRPLVWRKRCQQNEPLCPKGNARHFVPRGFLQLAEYARSSNSFYSLANSGYSRSNKSGQVFISKLLQWPSYQILQKMVKSTVCKDTDEKQCIKLKIYYIVCSDSVLCELPKL